MRVITVLVAILFLGTAAASSVTPPAVVPALDPVLRADPDGGHTIVVLLEDGLGGSYRHFPVSDAGIAAFTNAAEANDVFVDPIVYQANLKEVGVFAHSFTLDGAPYMTVGTYVRTSDAGIVRMPVASIENVADFQAATMLLASIVGDDAMPLVAEAIPHAYSLATPDIGLIVLLGAIAVILVASAPLLAVATLQGADGSTPLANLPPETYPALQQMGIDAFLLVFPLLFGPQGLPAPAGTAAPYQEDWVDRPEVRVWTVHKSGAGSDVWKGTYLRRTGSSNGATADDFEGTKRVETGLVTRIDGAVTHVAGVYLQTDVARAADSATLASIVRYSVGATTADALDVPLAAVEMEQSRRAGSSTVAFFPDEQQEDWRVGVYAGADFVPLVGARTTVTHHIHADTTNLGEAITEIETERITSVGAYAAGDYVPVVGARYWGERFPAELYALGFAGGGLLGDQLGGDVEVSAGAFVLGAYVPVVGARIDDDFLHHLYDHRSMVSAGTYVQGAFQPLVATTYDGQRPLLPWALGHAGDGADGDTEWQTSVGTFTLDFYRPVFGTRYEPRTQSAERAQQESYQFGVYPLHYDPFIPVVALEYDGETSSVVWAQRFAGGATGGGREGVFDADVVAFTPGPFAFPLVGVQYRNYAPDMAGAYDTHVVLGVYDGATFTPLAGASFSGDDDPLGLASAPGEGDVRVSVGHYVGGAYVPLATADTALLPSV